MNKPDEQSRENRTEVVIPVVEEEVVAGARPVKTGSVRVDKHVRRRIRRVETPLLHEEVEVRRVPVNRVVTEQPRVRRRGDLIIIPVVEEELVITKRLVLKEEIYLQKTRTKERFVQQVAVDHERAEVHRLDKEGRILDDDRPQPKTPPRRRIGHRSILD